MNNTATTIHGGAASTSGTPTSDAYESWVPLKAAPSPTERIRELETKLVRIRNLLAPLAGNRKFMPIAGPARQVLNIIAEGEYR